MSVKVKVNMKAPDFTGFVDAKLLSDVESRVINSQIKPLIASGTSPVRGYGRFPGYINPSKYPGSKKPKRPVNLELSGDLLRSYGAFAGKSTKSFFIGIFSSSEKSIKDRAEGNNYGTSGAPVRRIVPSGTEMFKVSVITALREVFSDAVGRSLKRNK